MLEFRQVLLVLCISVVGFSCLIQVEGKTEEERVADAKKFLTDLETEFSSICATTGAIAWKYYTNITDESEKANIDQSNEFSRYTKVVQKKVVEQFSDWKTINDPSVRRELKYLIVSGPGNMSDEDVEKLNKLGSNMDGAYSKATVCEYKNPTNCGLNLNPFITRKLESSTDPEELAYYWNAWHDATSEAIPASTYKQFVDYLNQFANSNGYPLYSDYSMTSYDTERDGWTMQAFLKELMNIWEQIRPKYDILYAYVRMKLRTNSPFKNQIEKCGKIPIHLTGNMWGQSWAKLDKYTKPYPKAPSLDITPLMKEMNYTVKKMFEVSDEFFQGLGLLKMTNSFWENSMLQRPQGREVACHATAHDMCRGHKSEDFRIKMCTEVNMKDLVTVHHEMGHIEYYQQYTDLPITFRSGANPGFHEAIGDTLALAVTTPQHLQCVLGFPLGLNLNCNKSAPSNQPPAVTETDMNHLFFNALEKMAFLGFSMAVDAWRLEVFDGKIQPADYNRKWWEIRHKFQGLSLPNPRNDSMFDPSAKYHIPSNTEYIRYFFSAIVQFSFYEAMCKAAGEYDPNNQNSKPLYQCDFDGNKKAGKLLGDMLKVGFKDPWPVPLKAMTGHGELRADSFLNYFAPLFTKLEEELKAGGEWECLVKT